ncbi:MAG: CotH kinase family protein [Solobacterium sp.]|nr:CotH kinase family protein [Solobacterium sp.]
MRKKNVYFYLLSASLLVFSLLSGCQSNNVVYEPAEVSFSVESGAYPGDVSLEISAPKGYTIRYTTDGSLPDEKSAKYNGKLLLSGNGNHWLSEETIHKIILDHTFTLEETPEIPDAWIIRAASFSPDGTMGPVSTHTYFPNRSLTSEYPGIMVISLVTEPENLLDYEKGIMVTGKYYDEWTQKEGSSEILKDNNTWYLIEGNYTQNGKDWERPVTVELFDESDQLSVRQDGGLRIQGHASRMYSHKSFRVYFRKDYGEKRLMYDLFPGDGTDSYRYITLRNGGNAAQDLPFKDAWQQSLLTGMSFTIQQARPAVLYLNGEYWGVYVLNDRYCDEYLEDHFGVKDTLIIKENEVQDGDESAYYLYEELLSYSDKDLSDPVIWDQFSQIVDIQGMADYFAAEIYMGNDFRQDSNMELWRTINVDPENEYADGRWRFMMYDTEYSSGLYEQEFSGAENNSLTRIIENQPVFASALRNPDFRKLFMESLKRIGAEIFAPERVNSTLDQWSSEWLSLMDDQFKRFGANEPIWYYNIHIIKKFYAERYKYIISYAEDMLGE